MAGGGGGGGGFGTFRYVQPADLSRLVRREEERGDTAAFDAEVTSELGSLLAAANGRDHALVRARLDDAKKKLEGQIEGTVDQLFGGSVAKHTYVDGLSDIDSLIVVNDSELADESPQKALKKMKSAIEKGGAGGAVRSISVGKMAVTIEYSDGMSIQLLPAIKLADGKLKVPSSRRDGWSSIDPEGFRTALTRRNEECGGKLVPTIKLAKAILGQLPEQQRLSGYHVEALAISAFRDYEGEKVTRAMLPAFFEKASNLVLAPIRDRTGQSVHVDEYLGGEKSPERQAASHILDRISRRMRNANAAQSKSQWRALFGLDQ